MKQAGYIRMKEDQDGKDEAHCREEAALEALEGARTLNEIASQNNMPPSMLSRWRGTVEKEGHVLFEDSAAKERREEKEQKKLEEELYEQIGRLTAENTWPKKLGTI